MPLNRAEMIEFGQKRLCWVQGLDLRPETAWLQCSRERLKALSLKSYSTRTSTIHGLACSQLLHACWEKLRLHSQTNSLAMTRQTVVSVRDGWWMPLCYLYYSSNSRERLVLQPSYSRQSMLALITMKENQSGYHSALLQVLCP